MGRPKGSTREKIRTRTKKRCGRCKLEKSLSAFGRSSHHGDGLKTECKECRNSYRYQNDEARNTHLRRCQERYQHHRLIIEKAKNEPCADCGHQFPGPVMHFHHRDPKTKFREVAKLVGHQESILLAEIDKCDVLCANCHIIRHISV